VGSKAAGFVLVLRVLFTAVPAITAQWSNLLMVISAVTILYGNLCAVPQRKIKRLLGYSSISHAGYMLLGISALAVSLGKGAQPSTAGASAVLYYLSGYLFTVLGAFTVICLALRQVEGEDIAALAGLNRRSPLLAATMALAMISLAGIPPLAGFFGKFLLLKSIITEAPGHPACYWLAFIALVGVVISLYYYFGVVSAMYWSRETPGLPAITPSRPIRLSLLACAAGMLLLGVCPAPVVGFATQAVQTFGPAAPRAAAAPNSVTQLKPAQP
jgi:NADH-quinone oxidoreductase subunit N